MATLPAAAGSLTLLLLLALAGGRAALAEDADPAATLRGHLEAFGKQGPSLSIDQVDGFIPPREFVENYVMQNRPLLFKGAAKKSPAFTRWTDEYFKASVPARPSGDVFIEHNKKENRSQAYNYIHFKKFLDTYNTSNIYMVSEVPEFLLQDLILPFPLQCKFFMQGGLDTHVVWFSSGGTSSVIHHDAYENINCLYRGRKTLVFLNTTRYRQQTEKIIDRIDGAFSSVDVDKIDLVARPEFRDLEFHSAEMEIGDCLYIPLFWVHQVRSFDNNLAVNIWWPPREKYPLDVCMPKYSTSIPFGKVYFRTIEANVRNDVDYTRRIIHGNLPPDDRTESALLNLLSAANAEAAASQEFRTAVSAIFKSLDSNMDGNLSSEELEMVLKRKQFRPVYKAISNYNVVVYAMHEAVESRGGAEARLPKLLRTSHSDEAVFAQHRTWLPYEPPNSLEEEDDQVMTEALTGVGSEDGDGMESSKMAEQENKKDEL